VRLTGTSRILGVHPESSGDDSFVVVTSANAQGQDVREARVKVQPGAPSTEALGLLSDWAATGKADPPVEVTRGAGAKPLPGARVVAAGAAGAAVAGAGAAEASAPASGAAPAAASSEPDPNATHFEASLRVGFGLPLGTAAGTASGGEEKLSDWSSFTIPI